MPTHAPQSTLAASHLISSTLELFRHDEHLRYFFFHHQELRLRDTPRELLEESRIYSMEDQILIQVGLDFWGGAGASRIHEIIEHFGDENILAFIRAILRLREMDLYVTLEVEPPCLD